MLNLIKCLFWKWSFESKSNENWLGSASYKSVSLDKSNKQKQCAIHKKLLVNSKEKLQLKFPIFSQACLGPWGASFNF